MNSLLCHSNSPVQRRFVSRMFLSALGCVLFSLAAAVFFRRVHHAAFYIAWPVAVLPALPILGALVATGAYLKDFAGVPAFPLAFVYPFFWVVAGLSIAVLLRRYR